MAADNPKTRVLVVDDDVTLLEMYRARLDASGYDVITAKNGEEALARAVDYLPHVILLDVMMPNVNGFEALEILKNTPETKNIPVIILTALGQEEHRKRGMEAGAVDYIIKADTMPGQVVAKIQEVLAAGRRE